MNNGLDVIALYGAILSTALATIQYAQWKKSQQAILVTWSKDLQGPKYHLQATIANLQNFPVYLEFVGVGYTYRPWSKPWLVRPFEIPSMKGHEGDYLSHRAVEGALKSGDAVDAWFGSSDFQCLEKPGIRSGFHRRICVWVDHSGDDKSFANPLTWIE